MTALVFRRFRPEPPLLLRRFGPDGRLAGLADRLDLAALPAVVGPQGAAGVPDLVAESGAAIGALKAVRVDGAGLVQLADKDSAAEVVGVTVAAAASGASTSVRIGGAIDDPAWSWAEGPVWLGAAGALTQVPPGTGHLVIVGRSAGATRLIVAPEYVAELL